MNKNKKIIGLTGPSQFSSDCRDMITDYLGAIAIDINQNGPDIDRVAGFCDAFVFAGGVDIFPYTLNPENAPRNQAKHIQHGNHYTKFDRKRDLREVRLIELAKKSGKKILGICRGHQLLLAKIGFNLIDDISGYSDIAHQPQGIELQEAPIHYIDSFGANGNKFINKNDLVNSFHHQAIHLPPNWEEFCPSVGVEILGTAHTIFQSQKRDEEKIIELARSNDFICCQWHPECDWHINETSKRVLAEFKNMIEA